MAMKKRLDVYLHEQGFAESRERAKALVIAGNVYINGQRCDKPSAVISDEQNIRVKKPQDYVSRGGKKLEKALTSFNIDVDGKVAIDVGASTGGFTDCMLQRGAKFVYAVDVGHGQFAWSLRQDGRVRVLERVNARHLSRDMFEMDINFASIDVSFISLKLIIPAVIEVLTKPFGIVTLIKPQFEAGKENVGKKGVVRDKYIHADVIRDIVEFAESKGVCTCGLTYSPIKGPEGNIEYLAYFRDGGTDMSPDIGDIVEQAHKSLSR
jgi:23S rRNA (cytidine1920-2'-O)/16S rRNA (cytidine1409-2'-O)-methyltransferase